MKLLIFTQKIDKNDDLLGFMHGWVAEFAKHFESIIVIALGVSEYHLPENVKVFSLGKDSSVIHNSPASPSLGGLFAILKKIGYAFRFYNYIWSYRNKYDCVLVHMNREYMLLGGLFWRLWGKKSVLWYNHAKGNIFSILAGCLAKKIFYTSPFSFFAKWSKAQIMPAGIDTEIFKKNEDIQSIKNSILYLGRLSPVKNVQILIEAANLLDKDDINFIFNIVGESGKKDGTYFNKLKELAKNLEQKGKVKFWGKLSHSKTPEIYNQNKVLVNLTNPGSLDKTILEAMACEELVLVSNESFKNILPAALLFQEDNVSDLVKKLKQIFNLSEEDYVVCGRELRAYVFQNHNLSKLAEKITMFFKN